MKTFPAYILIMICVVYTGITSCETNATIDVPESVPKLVVSCFLSPQDTVIRVKVSRSRPIFSDNVNYDMDVADATVIISNGVKSVTLPFVSGGSTDLDYYKLPVSNVFPIKGGATYYLNVSAPELIPVEASCTIPQWLPDTMMVDINEADIYDIRCNVKWNDKPSQKNFYRVRVQSLLVDTNTNTPYSIYNFQPEGAELVNDLNNDGAQFNLTFVNDYLFHPEDVYDVYLMNIDENYFLYQRSYNDYNYYADPFSEATPIYTNIKNGLGIFCGYQQLVRRYNP